MVLEGCNWDAILSCETLRPAKTEIWESHCGQKYERRWIRQQTLCWNTFEQRVEKILKTEYISERMITMMLKVNQRKIVLTSVYLPHTGYADHQAEKM